MEPTGLATPGLRGTWPGAVCDQDQRVPLPDQNRVAQAGGLFPSIFPRRAGVSHTAGATRIRVVPAVAGLRRVLVRDHPALHFQWQAVLVPRNALWRGALWSVREP